MAYEITIDVIEKPPVEVTDETAEVIDAVHKALIGMPGDRAANITCEDEAAVKNFLKEAKAHADGKGWRFTRVGDIKGQPLRVSFRVVTKRAVDTAAEAGTDAADGRDHDYVTPAMRDRRDKAAAAYEAAGTGSAAA
jgi:hypothetical protein